MSKCLSSAAIAAGLMASVYGAADSAAPYSDLRVNLLDPEITSVRWNNPTIFSAERLERGVQLSYGTSYSSWESRTLQMNELILSVVPSESWLVWYSYQNYVAKGRGAASRFRTEANNFGARYLAKQPDEMGVGGMAVEFEVMNPGTGFARSGGLTVRYNATRNWTLAGLFSDHAYDYRVGYTSVKGSGTGSADVFDLAMGKDFDLSDKLDARLQAHLIFQRASIGNQRSNDVKPVLFGALNYQFNRWLSLEGDVTMMPTGIPMAGGRLTPMTSFQVYNPGGAVGGLRNSFLLVGSLRLVAGTRF